MNLKELLARSRKILSAALIEDAALEVELLLRHVLGIGRVQLYADLNHETTSGQEEAFWQLVQRRLSGEPAAYITGHREFYGLDFYVDRRVLIPRPESELLVEEALGFARQRRLSVMADIGTGSGCIAISLALNLPQVKIYATDISASALQVARPNCERHGVCGTVCLLEGDLLDPLPEPVDLIVANLPYVRKHEVQASHLCFEPAVALDGGSDGLEKIRKLCTHANSELHPGGFLLLEIGESQAEIVSVWLRSLFPSAIIRVKKDSNGLDRMISLALPAADTLFAEPLLGGAGCAR